MSMNFIFVFEGFFKIDKYLSVDSIFFSIKICVDEKIYYIDLFLFILEKFCFFQWKFLRCKSISINISKNKIFFVDFNFFFFEYFGFFSKTFFSSKNFSRWKNKSIKILSTKTVFYRRFFLTKILIDKFFCLNFFWSDF